MEEAVSPIPEGFSTVNTFLIVPDGDIAIRFIEEAFDGEVTSRLNRKNGDLWSAEMRIGTTMIMISQGTEGFPAMKTMLHLYVEDADAVYAKAVAAGATPLMPVEDQFYGDRSGGVEGPDGNYWWIGTRIRNYSEEELQRISDNQ